VEKNPLDRILFILTGFVWAYFSFVPKQYESTATILPSTEDNYMSGLYSMMKNFSSVMPGSLGNIKKESEMDLYKTIIIAERQ